MDPFAQWHRVFEILNLPVEPDVVLAAPGAEQPVRDALAQVRPAARVAALELGPGPALERADHPRLPLDLDRLARILTPGSVDLILLDHALDDIVLRVVAQHDGIELTDEPQGEYSAGPRALRAYWRSGDLEGVVAPRLLALLGVFERALRESGGLILHHWVVGGDLLVGQPFELYSEYVPVVRRWIEHASLSFREEKLDGLDPHWWLWLAR